MGICPKCQKEKMVAIGTEKFSNAVENVNDFNWQWHGYYKIFVVMYCHKCNVISMREPNVVYG